MKSLTVRLPDALVAQLEAESRERKVSKAHIIRERLMVAVQTPPHCPTIDSIADLIGSVHGLPPDLSARKKEYLKKMGYRRKRHH